MKKLEVAINLAVLTPPQVEGVIEKPNGVKVIHQKITDPTGKVLGHFNASLFPDEHTSGNPFAEYVARMPFSPKFPCMWLDEIFIHPDHRRKGYAKKGLMEFRERSASLGASSGILKVGWGLGEDHLIAESGKKRLYAECGWAEFEKTREYEHTIMFLMI
jgi:GNAT superfamily N-acetyltransferase